MLELDFVLIHPFAPPPIRVASKVVYIFYLLMCCIVRLLNYPSENFKKPSGQLLQIFVQLLGLPFNSALNGMSISIYNGIALTLLILHSVCFDCVRHSILFHT